MAIVPTYTPEDGLSETETYVVVEVHKIGVVALETTWRNILKTIFV
jgi:hypothetical protein